MGGQRSTAPQNWGGPADLRPPSGPRPAKKRAETKPLGMAAPLPPPPAGAGLEDEADPVAGLFAADRTVAAPSINDAPSEAEIGRWAATASTSLFDERVKDPAPAAEPAPPPAARASDPRPRQSPKLFDLEAAADPVDVPDMSEPEPTAARKQRAPAPPAPAAAAPAKSAKRASSASGARKRAVVAAEPPEAPEAEEAVKPARKRRLERGPSKVLLAAVGAATLAALGAAAVLLGVVPNPFAEPAPGPARALRPRAAAPAKPANAAATAPAKATATAVAAAKPVASPAAKPSAPAAPKPTAVAPAAVAPKPVPPAASAAAEQPAPAAKPVAVAQPAPVAPAPVREEPSDEREESDEGGGGGSGKLSQARKLLGSDNPAAAEALARQVLAADPSDHHAMDVLARALMDQDRGAEAVPLARKMVQRRGKRVPYRLLLGDLLLMVGDEAGARAEWQKALALAPGDKDIKRRLGQ